EKILVAVSDRRSDRLLYHLQFPRHPPVLLCSDGLERAEYPTPCLDPGDKAFGPEAPRFHLLSPWAFRRRTGQHLGKTALRHTWGYGKNGRRDPVGKRTQRRFIPQPKNGIRPPCGRTEETR